MYCYPKAVKKGVTLPLMPTKTGSLLRHQSSSNNHETKHVGLCDCTQMRSVIQISWQSLTVSHNHSSDLLYYTTFKLLTCKISNLWIFFGECALKIALSRNTFQPKMHQISLGGRTPPEPAGGTYSASPGPLAGLKGLLPRAAPRFWKWGGQFCEWSEPKNFWPPTFWPVGGDKILLR